MEYGGGHERGDAWTSRAPGLWRSPLRVRAWRARNTGTYTLAADSHEGVREAAAGGGGGRPVQQQQALQRPCRRRHMWYVAVAAAAVGVAAPDQRRRLPMPHAA